MRRHPQLARLVPACLATLPAFIVLALIWKYGVDVPFWDQWEIAPFFEKLSRGALSAADLFAQQNEYRQFFPNLVFVALGRATRWDVRAEMLFSLLLACLVSFNVYRLGKITVGGGAPQRLWLLFVSNLLIFSPIQYENWLFGVQIVYYVPVACVTGCVVVALSGLGERSRFLVCMCLAAVSTFSSANGIVCWLVAPPVLVWPWERRELWARRWWLLAWAAGAALCVALYLHGYAQPPYKPDPATPLSDPLGALLYFLAFLGSPLAVGPHPLAVAAAFGAAQTLLFAAVCLYVLRFASDPALARRSAGWLMIGAYSLFTAALVTFGRMGYGIEQALSSRYTTYSLYLGVSLIHLLPVVLDDPARRGHFARGKVFLRRLALPAAVSLALAYAVVSVLVVRHGMSVEHRRRLHAKACMLFVNVLREKCADELYPGEGQLAERAGALDRLGYLRPALIKSRSVRDIEAAGEAGVDYGAFERLTRGDDGVYVATGRASLPHAGRPADAVVLAYETAEGDFVAAALAGVGGQGDCGAAETAAGDARRAGSCWRRSLPPGEAPGVPVRVGAWAFDAETGKAYKLSGTHVIE